MLKRMKKWLVMVMVVVLMLSLVSPAAAQIGSSSSDLTGHWAREEIEKWVEYGVVKGYPDGSFHPNDGITRAEFVTILNRIFGFYVHSEAAFSDVPATAWYASALAIAREAGYYEGFSNNTAKPDSGIIRQDAVTLLARAFEMPRDASGSAVAYTDQGQIGSYARDAVQALSSVLSGYPDGSFRPNSPITRAEVITLLNKMIAGYFHEAGTVSGGTIAGHAVINRDGVELRNAAIAGNLYLAAGIADGNVLLDNVSVAGKTSIKGGGEHTVTVRNSKLNEVSIDRKDGVVRLLITGDTSIANLVVNKANKLELEPGAKIERLTITSGAAGTEITGAGSILKMDVQADKVSINGVAVDKGISTITNGKITPTPKVEVPAITPPSTGGSGSGGNSGGDSNVEVINIVDPLASENTKSLFAYLQDIRGKQVLFGQQYVTDYGLTITNPTGAESDVTSVVYDYPALFGFDTLTLEGKARPGSSTNTPDQNVAALIGKMEQAHDLGGIITLSTHSSNFVTGGIYNDNSKRVVTDILPGGEFNNKLNSYLDKIADVANGLKDNQGNSIPIILRLWHEQNGGWFWWGNKTTTPQEYIELFRYSVEYLRDTKGVRNLLYAWSPIASFSGKAEDYLVTYPGDDYVDIMGLDQYDNKNSPGTSAFLNGMVQDIAMISRLADQKGKVAAFTEFGVGMKETGNLDRKWFTKVMNALKADPNAKRIAFMLAWANLGYPDNNFVPYRGHELADDFKDYYADPYTVFASEMKGVYDFQVKTNKDKAVFTHVVSPLDLGTVKQSTTKIRLKVLHGTPTSVVYSVYSSGTEIPMTLDAQGYYSADWSPEVSSNGKTEAITVKVYDGATVLFEKTNLVYIKIDEIALKTYNFDSGIVGFQYNGEWYNSKAAATKIGSIQQAVYGGNNFLQINVKDMISTDAWQEVKVQMTKPLDVDFTKVSRVKFDVWIPVSSGSGSVDASVKGIAMLPPDNTNKYHSAEAKLVNLGDKMTIGGVEYYKYKVSIDLTNADAVANATGIQLSVVGKYLTNPNGSIYVDNIQLLSVYAGPDPAIIDDFENYAGSDAAILSAYNRSSNGDALTVSLDTVNKKNGDYAMKYVYTLGTAGYAGVTKQLGGRDWSKFNQLQFWLVPDGQNQKVVIQMKLAGSMFEYYPSVADTTPRLVKIPFNMFVPVHGTTGVITKERLKNAQEFSIYTNAVGGAQLSSALYFDDIVVVNDGAAGVVPEGDTGPVINYGFETSTDSWTIDTTAVNTANATNMDRTTAQAASGGYSLKADFNNTTSAGQLLLHRQSPLDLSTAKGLSVKLKVIAAAGTPSTGVTAAIFVKVGALWTWKASTYTAVNDNGFTTLTFDISSIADRNQVKAIGVIIKTPAGASGNGTVYLDDFISN